MKQKSLLRLLVAEALLCLGLVTYRHLWPEFFAGLAAFPYQPLGRALRALALLSPAGNGLAWFLYLLLSLLPIIALILIRRRRPWEREDLLLVLFSALLLPVLYLMINPGLIGIRLGAVAALEMGPVLLGGVAHSLLIGYGVLRLLRRFYTADAKKLRHYLAALLSLLILVYAFLIFGVVYGGFIDELVAVRAANRGFEHTLGLSYGFLALQSLVSALPHGLVIWVLFAAQELLAELGANFYSEEALAAARKLSGRAAAALKTMVAVPIGFNLLQLLFVKNIADVRASIQVPLSSMALVLLALLLAQYLRQNKELKEDLDMIV